MADLVSVVVGGPVYIFVHTESKHGHITCLIKFCVSKPIRIGGFSHTFVTVE